LHIPIGKVNAYNEFQESLFRIPCKEGIPMLPTSQPKGQGFLEYALIIMLVVVIVIVVLAILGPQVGKMYSNIIVGV
jgi:pilus assembly protein Flp/PilA